MSDDISLKQALSECDAVWSTHAADMAAKGLFVLPAMTRHEVITLRQGWMLRWLNARSHGAADLAPAAEPSPVERLIALIESCPLMNASTCFVTEINWRSRARSLVAEIRTTQDPTSAGQEPSST